jgi:protocatechuate 3,4-dioxygenase beta subunit
VNRGTRAATASQTVGPFFHHGLQAQPGRGADRTVTLTVRVTDGDARPVDDALVELWTSDAFARIVTGKDGTG